MARKKMTCQISEPRYSARSHRRAVMSEIERQQTREIPTPMRWRTPRHLIPKLEIVNVAATAELNQFINLGLLVSVEGFVYNPDVYRCAYLKDENTRGKVSIFVSGKMISVGT